MLPMSIRLTSTPVRIMIVPMHVSDAAVSGVQMLWLNSRMAFALYIRLSSVSLPPVVATTVENISALKNAGSVSPPGKTRLRSW